MEQTAAKANTLPAKHHFDFIFFAAVLTICAFGLVMLYSASYYTAITKHNDGAFFIKKQLLFFGVGLGLMLLASHVKFTFWEKPIVVIGIYLLLLVLLAATLVWGEKINEARRWLKIFGFQFQPSEFTKFGVVIVLSALICSGKLKMQSFVHGVLHCIILLLPLVGLIFFQPNYSLIVLLAIISYVMLYIGGTNIKLRFILIVVGLAAGILLLFVEGYRQDRITAYFHPESDPTGKSYQIIQSRIALANGGFFGQGFNASRQKLNFLPEMENDYILAIIGEEFGFLGVFLLLAAYFFTIFRGFVIAMRCQDRFGRMLGGGVISVLAIQTLLNVGVVSSALPSTGQTLPFISYGGTSLMVFMGAMGIILNISRYSEVRTRNARRRANKSE